MIKIGMFCFAGMSTSVLVKKMKELADEKKLDCEINAYPETKVSELAQKLDIILIGPQIKYYRKRIEEICKTTNTKVMVISNVDFGRMDAENILNQALALLK